MDYFKTLLGMYVCQKRVRSIFLNNKMDEYLTFVVAAHELGHDSCHRELAVQRGFKEFEMFDMRRGIAEYEANAFAAHLLLDTDECVELFRNGYDIGAVSKIMNTGINLMLIKCHELIKLGYDLRMPMDVHGDFLKKIKI